MLVRHIIESSVTADNKSVIANKTIRNVKDVRLGYITRDTLEGLN